MTDAPIKQSRPLFKAAPVVLTLTLLGAVLVDKSLFHVAPPDASAYHARVREAAKQVPHAVGRWLGTDCEVPEAAVKLLHPNVAISRQYRDVLTGRTANFLFVQCEDARDLIGHYPPVCYVAHGWVKAAAIPGERAAAGGAIPVTDYTFTSRHLEGGNQLRIDNFMVLPDGSFCRDMEGVESAARNYRRKFFGAAQVQIITDPDWSESDRYALFGELIGAAKPLLDTIRSGVTR